MNTVRNSRNKYFFKGSRSDLASGAGFTLLEITVVVAIISLLSTIFIVNYQGGERSFALRRSAHQLSQDLRMAQEMAMSSQEFENTFPAGGYGIYFKKDSNSYFLFADCDGDHSYDEPGSAPTCAPGGSFFKGERIKEIFLEQKVKISTITPSSISNTLEITFFPPDPETTINSDSDPESDADSASIVLTSDGQSVEIKIYSTGLIDIQ